MNGLYGLFFLLVAVLLSAGCDRTAQKDEERQDNEQPETSEDERGRKRPEETITLERAHEMYKAYRERAEALANLKDGEEDASYGWHSIGFYKNYIAYLEREARKVRIPISGLRMYYVAYPEGEDGKYSGYQTYMYVPTYYDKEAKRHIAFDPLHIGDDGKPLPIHEIIVGGMDAKRINGKEVKQGAMLMRVAEATISSIANMGEMCEPNCENY
ncbi:hypothetical protein C900_01396 [Fulvivirga imtechensis AK7]|uniref:Lipoprotein n=2 Tax=Fulvivirga TaxID=396811 RepID=L8JXL7_9BACT|nr:hypothetical protein C900_01396 [Fulvivirga imtechensis AK7]